VFCQTFSNFKFDKNEGQHRTRFRPSIILCFCSSLYTDMHVVLWEAYVQGRHCTHAASVSHASPHTVHAKTVRRRMRRRSETPISFSNKNPITFEMHHSMHKRFGWQWGKEKQGNSNAHTNALTHIYVGRANYIHIYIYSRGGSPDARCPTHRHELRLPKHRAHV